MDDNGYYGPARTAGPPAHLPSQPAQAGVPAQTASDVGAVAVMLVAGLGELAWAALVLALDSSSRSNGGYAGMPAGTGLVGLRYDVAHGSGWLAALLFLGAVSLAIIPPPYRWAVLGGTRAGAVGRVVAAQLVLSIAGVMLLPG